MGKIQSVTNANVAEYVNDRKALGSEVKTPEEVAKVDKEISGQPVKPAAEVAPAPIAEPPKDDKKGKNSLQERIDELTRLRKEADEFAEDTYGQLQLSQRRIKELEAQILPPPPKVEQKPEPKPTDDAYKLADGSMDQEKFLKDWGKWQREMAIAEFKAQEERDRQEAAKREFIREAEARRQKSLEAARKDFPDFDDKIEQARVSVETQRRESPNLDVDALISESDYGAHILYYLVDHPEEVTKWNRMRPSQVAIAIGRLETKFSKPVEQTTIAASAATPKTTLPEPTPSLGAGGGAIPVDIAGPMDFKTYRERRKAELAKKRR